MLKAGLRKIKSAPKRFVAGVLLVGFGVGIIVIIVLAGTGKITWDGPAPSDASLRIGNHTYELETASTQAAQEKGLGDRASMPANRGMLFVFDSQGQQCFWMKDMRFPLDIIWTDSAKKITAVESNLSPATYPKTYCHDGRYVIEVHAGVAEGNHMAVGQKLSF